MDNLAGYDDIHHKGELVRPAHWLSASGGRRYLRRREIPRLCVRVKNISVRCANGSPFAPTFFGRSAGLTGSCIPSVQVQCIPQVRDSSGSKCWNRALAGHDGCACPPRPLPTAARTLPARLACEHRVVDLRLPPSHRHRLRERVDIASNLDARALSRRPRERAHWCDAHFRCAVQLSPPPRASACAAPAPCA